MEEEFYASIKLVSGEEIFSSISASEEEDRTLLILDTPVTMEAITSKFGELMAFKISPWMKLTEDSLFIIDINKVITMTEVTDINIIKLYEKYRHSNVDTQISRDMGFISKVNDARELLERTFNNY